MDFNMDDVSNNSYSSYSGKTAFVPPADEERRIFVGLKLMF